MYKIYSINELKKIAKQHGCTFKKCRFTYNNQAVYAMFNEYSECVSIKTTVGHWSDIVNNDGVLENLTAA